MDDGQVGFVLAARHGGGDRMPEAGSRVLWSQACLQAGSRQAEGLVHVWPGWRRRLGWR